MGIVLPGGPASFNLLMRGEGTVFAALVGELGEAILAQLVAPSDAVKDADPGVLLVSLGATS